MEKTGNPYCDDFDLGPAIQAAYKRNNIISGSAVVADLVGTGIVIASEIKRTQLVNPTFNGFHKPSLEDFQTAEKFAHQVSPTVLQLLQKSGDFMEGFLVAGGVYGFLSLCNAIMESGGQKISYRTRASLSLLVSAGIIVAAETNLIGQGYNYPDTGDIPIGILGGAGFIGTHFAGRWLGARGIELNDRYHITQTIRGKIKEFDERTGVSGKTRPYLDKVKGFMDGVLSLRSRLLDPDNEEDRFTLSINNKSALHTRLVKPVQERDKVWLTEDRKKSLRAIGIGEREIRGDKTYTAITINYQTSSGLITEASENASFGDMSRIRTLLVTEGGRLEQDQKGRWIMADPGKNTILLYYPGTMPTPEQYNAVVLGEEDVPADRRLLAERYDPTQPHLMGIKEPFGTSQCRKDVRGDDVILESIREFNKQYSNPDL